MLKVEDYIEHYNSYFKEFSRLAVGEYADLSYGSDKPNPTASSLESITAYSQYLFDKWDFANSVSRLLNAGSGASSWMFRKTLLRVIDTDPNLRYGQFVQMLCKQNGIYWNNFSSGLLFNGIDHTYYDYGDIERLPFLGAAIETTRKSLYIDDVDCRDECMPYRKHVIDLCKAMGLKWFDCLSASDAHGRWGIIIEK